MVYNKFGIFISLLLLVVFLVGYFLLRKYKTIPVIFPLRNWLYFLNFFQKVLLICIVVLSLIIPLNIWIYQWTKIEKKPTLNIQILFDVSLSMIAKDIKPNRFEATKAALVEFVKSLDAKYNISVITFSGKPFVWIPFTNDKKALIWKISDMKMPYFLPSIDFVWTAIWDALLLWTYNLYKFSFNKEKPGVILLLTDWYSNKWVKVSEAIKYVKKFNIPVFVGAIWKDKTYVLWKDIFGNTVRARINLDSLKKIAKQTNWEFKIINQKSDLLDILAKLRNYVKSTEILKKENEYLYLNYYLLLTLFFLLILYGFFFIRFKL